MKRTLFKIVITKNCHIVQYQITAIVKDLQQGAATSLKCAVDPELNSQEHFYYDDCKVTPSQSVSQYVSGILVMTAKA